ncbi:hypothetical protein QBC45DRAFT_331508, partial [Copromyces sp. CBS 386.78]
KINNIFNQKSATLIAKINTAEYAILTYIIFKTDPIEDFLNNNLNNSIRFARLPIGFLNTKFTLD